MHPSTGYDGTLGEPHLLYYQFKHSQNSGLQYISCTLAPVYDPSRLQATVKLYHDGREGLGWPWCGGSPAMVLFGTTFGVPGTWCQDG